MNQRQKKKQLKKIVELMNRVEVDEYDGQGNELVYVLANVNKQHQEILENICSITKANKAQVNMMYLRNGFIDDKAFVKKMFDAIEDHTEHVVSLEEISVNIKEIE